MLRLTLNVLSAAPSIWRLKRSGVFDAQAYADLNTDIAGKIPASMHWLLFGREEDRATGVSPRAQWLLPYLADGIISARDAQALMTLSLSSRAFTEILERLGLNIYDLNFLEALDAQDVDTAIECAAHMSPERAFDAAYLLANRYMHMSRLDAALGWAQQQSDLSFKQTVQLCDIAKARGTYTPEHRRRLRDALAALPNAKRPDYQVFGAMWPYIEHAGKQELAETHGLVAVNQTSPGRLGQFVQSVGRLAPLINAATHYSVSGEPKYLRQTAAGTLEYVAASEATPDNAVCIRLLMPAYWTNAQRDHQVTGPVLELHIKLIETLLADGKIIQPQHATPIFDVSREETIGLETFSYHTVSDESASGSNLHYKESHIPGYYSVDSTGYSGWSTLAQKGADFPAASPDERDKCFDNLVSALIWGGKSKYDQADIDEPGRPRDGYLFAILQVPDDTVARWRYMSTQNWVKCAAETAKVAGLKLVIKRHPYDKSRSTDTLLRALEALDHVYISKAPIHELLANCRVVITVNSGAGFEALLHLKPVILCGAADYSAVTVTAKSPKQLAEHINLIVRDGPPHPPSVIKQFVYSYTQSYCAQLDRLSPFGLM